MPEAHPNKSPFAGILAIVDEPSDRSPSGARGHKVILTRRAAQDALWSLIGMGVNVVPGGEKHEAKNKVGVIEHAEVIGNTIYVRGYIFGWDMPEIVSTLQAAADPWGMSYEAHDAHVDDLRAAVWTVSKVTFTGAAIMPLDRVAYKKTKFYFV